MEKEELREKIRKIGIDYEGVTLGYYEDLHDTETCVKELVELISQEVSKAREEGKLEYILSLGWQDTDNEYVKEVLEDAERIAEKLSKLKDNK